MAQTDADDRGVFQRRQLMSSKAIVHMIALLPGWLVVAVKPPYTPRPRASTVA